MHRLLFILYCSWDKHQAFTDTTNSSKVFLQTIHHLSHFSLSINSCRQNFCLHKPVVSLWVWVRVSPALSNLLLATQFIEQLVIVLALNTLWREDGGQPCKELAKHRSLTENLTAVYVVPNSFSQTFLITRVISSISQTGNTVHWAQVKSTWCQAGKLLVLPTGTFPELRKTTHAKKW